MTVFTWARRRRFPRLPEPQVRVFDVASDVRVLAKCHWQKSPASQPTLLLLHGLEGSADAHYMRGMADKAFTAGFNVVRLNQRNCGGTDHLSVGVYNSGLTSDPAAVIDELVRVDGLSSISVAGYSLGGNLTLKLAGEYGTASPKEVKAFAAVSPTFDLAACIDALERRANWLYQQNFLWSLKQRIRRKARLYPERYSTAPLAQVRSVRQFDDAYTAPMSGYRDSADYYYRASARRVVHQVRVPTLVITAVDDPFVPVDPFRDTALTDNPAIRLLVTPHGGHCGFVTRRADGDGDGYWAERAVVAFAAEHARAGGGSGSA
jgi:predicted alpha/beta-fold hydrolase